MKYNDLEVERIYIKILYKTKKTSINDCYIIKLQNMLFYLDMLEFINDIYNIRINFEIS